MTDSPSSSASAPTPDADSPARSKLAATAFFLGIATLVLGLLSGVILVVGAYADTQGPPGLGNLYGNVLFGAYVGGLAVVPALALLSLVLGLVAFLRGRSKTAHTQTKRRGLIAVATSIAGLVASSVGVVLLMMEAMRGLHGRALRIAGRPASARPVSRGDWSSTGGALDTTTIVDDLDDVSRAALARRWLDAAVLEHAAIPAFGLLALDLVRHGAGPDLVARAQLASLEEIEHAREAFAIASAFAGEPLGPSAIPALRDARSSGDLSELAVASLVDGCVGEGIGAALVAAAAHETRNPTLRTLLHRTAREEQSHADLAWAVLAFALDRGGEPVARATRNALARLDDSHAQFVDESDVPAGYGFVSQSRHAAICRAVIEDARRRIRADRAPLRAAA